MASSSSDQGATPSSLFKYDVFLSFRRDTRYSFTDHLYRALDKTKRINVFRDDPSLRLGDEIGATLLEAIEKSRMSIVVLCQNYASSSWCLNELVHILECSENGRKRPVLPVFYHVAPTEVRYQKNQYEAAMRKHEESKRYSNKVMETWRSALFAVCELSGKHCTGERYEADIVDQIVKEVLIKIPPEPLYIKHPTGSAFRFEGVKSLLDLQSHNNVLMVGIHHDGDDEMDIRNFAGLLYNEIRDQFDAASFLSSVGEKSAESNWGLENLQKTLLSEMGEEGTKRGSIFKGSSEIKQKLGRKRVLLILDDVDNTNQLEALAGGGNWFGPGSRIIVTTIDKDVLDDYELEDDLEMRICCIGESEFEGNVKEEYENVVGLEKDFEIVINQLKEEGSPENVVSIVGMGGLGKTTLARKIYKSDEVKKLFPCRAWATVSMDFNGKEVFKSLLKCLSKSKDEDSRSEEQLKQEVRNCLEGKKYLIVLDDVWDTNDPWDVLKGCFPDNKNGSIILLTTRDHRVANVSESKMPHHKLSFLDKEESWELFHNEVFRSKKCPPELEPVGRSIAERCNGLPMAIKIVARIVGKRDRSKDAWEGIKKLLPYWSVAEDKEGKKMMEILKLSYDDLPNNMKPCFLYLGVFPEDAKILVRDLIQLWIAEGFIKPTQTGRSKEAPPEPEDIGEEYLKELVDRNLIQVTKTRSDGKGVKKCQIHDLIRELCILVSNNSNNDRRLSFPRDIGSYACSVTCNQSSTCSLIVYGDPKGWQHHIPKDCQVNALYLRGYISGGVKNAAYLKRLKSLRFLKVESFFPYELFFKFHRLQTLYAMYIMAKEISIEALKQIRHIRCEISDLYLLADEERVEDKMQNVQTLYYIIPDSQLRFLLDNRFFPNLRSLGLAIGDDQRKSIEENLRSLEHLSKLQKLKLKIWVSKRVPLDKIAFPSNLIKIVLTWCKGFNFQDMNALGRIRRLQILKLNQVECTEEILNCGSAGSFPRLQVFIVKYMDVRRVTLEDDAMPSLRRAVFHRCHGLMRQSLPKKMRSLGGNLHFIEPDPKSVDDDTFDNLLNILRDMLSMSQKQNNGAFDFDDSFWESMLPLLHQNQNDNAHDDDDLESDVNDTPKAGSMNDDAHDDAAAAHDDDDDLLITQNRWMSRLRVFAVRSGWVLRKILKR